MNKKSIIAICIVLLIGIGLTIYFVSSSDNEDTDSSNKQIISDATDSSQSVVDVDNDTESIVADNTSDNPSNNNNQPPDDTGGSNPIVIYPIDDLNDNDYIDDATDSSESELVVCADRSNEPVGIKVYCDADGNRVKTENYFSGSLAWYDQKEFDADGNVVKRDIYDAEGNLERYTTFEYDAEGNVIKTESYDTDGNLEE